MRLYSILLLLSMTSLVNAQVYTPKFDLQGHRGARGLKPENTIPGFITALNYGVTTLELDVVISRDKRVVVSHEPWLSADICSKADGIAIRKEEEMGFNLYELTYDEIRQYDCGSRGNHRFPEQEKMAAKKPLLKDVFVAVEDHIKNYTFYEVDYNIEIKSRSEGDNKFHPTPEEFSDLVYSLIDQYLPWERVVIQSFDLRILKYWHAKYPSVRLAFLVENTKSPQKNLNELGFTPSVYSPYYKLLKKDQLDYLHSLTVSKGSPATKNGNGQIASKLRVIPWTVNEIEDMKQLKGWGVDGIITDYPNRAAEIGLAIKRNVSGKAIKK